MNEVKCGYPWLPEQRQTWLLLLLVSFSLLTGSLEHFQLNTHCLWPGLLTGAGAAWERWKMLSKHGPRAAPGGGEGSSFLDTSIFTCFSCLWVCELAYPSLRQTPVDYGCYVASCFKFLPWLPCSDSMELWAAISPFSFRLSFIMVYLSRQKERN